jgi:hypothetical protein
MPTTLLKCAKYTVLRPLSERAAARQVSLGPVSENPVSRALASLLKAKVVAIASMGLHRVPRSVSIAPEHGPKGHRRSFHVGLDADDLAQYACLGS